MMSPWLSVCLVVLLSADRLAAGADPQAFSTCKFSFEKRWELVKNEEADWRGEKTDFVWGDVEISHPKAEYRIIQYVVARDDYKDRKKYRAATREIVYLNGTRMGFQETWVGELGSIPNSIQGATEAYRKLSSSQGEKMYYFDPTPESPYEDLTQFCFLGYLSDGLVWKLHVQRQGNEYAFLTKDKGKWRYHLDPMSGLFDSVSYVDPKAKSEMRYTKKEGAKHFFVTDTEVESPIYKEVQELQVSNLKFDEKLEIRWKNAPPNGHRIDNLDVSHIKYDWKNGGPVKVLDRSVENVTTMHFPRRQRSFLVVVALLSILCLAFYLSKKRSKQ